MVDIPVQILLDELAQLGATGNEFTALMLLHHIRHDAVVPVVGGHPQAFVNTLTYDIVSDPVTGLALRLSSYGEYKQIRYEVSAVWGSVVDRPEWVIALLG